ncbi:MAG: D-aminoacyl-tRNA deacylase [Candidatus Tantalella remota]|nr:D-aminoacyl-tRNA deacylase [Candidatus Tantalella remota]
MRIVLQRVKEADVLVDGEVISAISNGFVLLVGVSRTDKQETGPAMAKKIRKLRVFEDERGKMNLDISEVNGSILSIPQFTLLGNTDKGNRPGFDDAALPAEAESLWKEFNEALRKEGVSVYEGSFGVHMQVSLMNDGPVTFVLDSKK